MCNTTRVIHLEITETQSTNDFLLAWRRFINKRGVHPSHAYSDRGQTFVGAQKPLRDWISNWNESIVRDTMASLSTTFEFSWDFNIPLASHMNGVVESLIRSCRKAFDSATDYHKRSYSYPEWETIVSESSYLINSRPMFPDSADDLDEELLTGNTLLYPHGQHRNAKPHALENIDPRLSVKAVHAFLRQFWESWLRNMPPSLMLRSKWF